MKRGVYSLLVILITFILACAVTVDTHVFASLLAAQGRSEISGTIFGDSRRPLADVYVELLDDVNSTLRRSRTNQTGRFTFTGLVNGRYVVRVLPYGTDYLEDSREVVLAAVSAVAGSGSDRQIVDFYLKLDERANVGPFAAGPGVVFVQDVPAEAQKLYADGVSYLRKKKESEGLASLKKALEIFPDYYLALDRLGAEYATRGLKNAAYLQAGYALLFHAVEVNPRGFSSLFGLGWTEYQLGMNREAIENLKRATSLYSKSADAYTWLGRALKRGSLLKEAEESFRQANQLANGKSSEVHWQLAQLYNEQKRYKEAADELELFLKLEPNAADAEKIKAMIKLLREKAPAKFFGSNQWLFLHC
jgi:tetratricopeptide (TPR) repeat protein